MKLSNISAIDYRSASIVHLPSNGMNGIEMIVPGASSSTFSSCCCSCGATSLKK